MDLLLQELPAKWVSSPLALHPVTFVSRYHPLFAHALSQAMAKAPMPLEFGMRILPSWSNGLPSTMSIVSRSNNANSRCVSYNDHGTTYHLSEEGGKIIVVLGLQSPQSPNTLLQSVNSCTLCNLGHTFCTIRTRDNSSWPPVCCFFALKRSVCDQLKPGDLWNAGSDCFNLYLFELQIADITYSWHPRPNPLFVLSSVNYGHQSISERHELGINCITRLISKDMMN